MQIRSDQKVAVDDMQDYLQLLLLDAMRDGKIT